MRQFQSQFIAISLILSGYLSLLTPVASAETPAIHAVLFYSNSCGHCHYVITEVFPPLFEQYGDQLQILGIEISDTEGQALYQAAIDHLNIPEEQFGVPTLIVGETVLVGSLDIPERFPGLIEDGLATGGIGWPDFPGMEAVLATVQAQEEAAVDPTAEPAAGPAAAVANPTLPAATVAPTAPPTDPPATAAPAETEAIAAVPADPPADGVLALYEDQAAGQETDADTVRDRLMRDLAGNMLSILVLIGMAAVLVYSVARLLRRGPVRGLRLDGWPQWALLVLFLAGLGVAVYLAFVETTETTAVCGPVGDCNTVQQSDYATLFGFLPVGVLGIAGYLAMALAWAANLWGPRSGRPVAAVALMGMALGGAIFSIYLTFLEPFVIGATCLWCLSSAVIMTAILLILVAALPEPQTVAWHEAQA
jgi:uncharacterized membrane protein